MIFALIAVNGIALAEIGAAMKTLSEHNEERCKSDRTIPRGQQMSTACDNCGAEMVNEYLAAQGDAHIDLVCPSAAMRA